jgi:hypothetical protein
LVWNLLLKKKSDRKPILTYSFPFVGKVKQSNEIFAVIIADNDKVEILQKFTKLIKARESQNTTTTT